MKKKLLFFVLSLVFCLFLYNQTQAQLSLDSGDVAVEINPEVPTPNQVVTVNVESYLVSLDTFYIEWFENDVLKVAGFGKKDFSFNSGNAGETTVVEVRIKEEENGDAVYSRRIVSKPASMDLLWQATDSYTPPFYKGKALPTSEGIIKIVAIPTFRIGFKNVSPKNVVYEWKRNFETLQPYSGYGKNTLSIKQSYLNNEEKISVTATETTEGSTAKGLIKFEPYEPKIVFYKKDPLQGILFGQGTVDGLTIGKNDTTIIASPYFVSNLDPQDEDLEYTWSLNGGELSTPEIKNQLILRGTDQTGQARLNLVIESATKLFLKATRQISLYLQ